MTCINNKIMSNMLYQKSGLEMVTQTDVFLDGSSEPVICPITRPLITFDISWNIKGELEVVLIYS